jgi:glycosyltransferase involved in cell wall biosynthesis
MSIVVEELRDDARRASEAGPSVSVVIPAYNVGTYIAETLEAVFAQTLKDFEVIVVNDGSPDTTELEKALAPYRPRISYFRQENRGAGAARNRGLREARGEFVAFLDGDDLWLPTFLEAQLSFMRSGAFDLAYTDAILFGQSALAGKRYMETAPSRGPVTFVSLLRGDCNVITSGVVARRSVVIDGGMFDEGLRNSQDFELWLRLARRGARFGYQRQVLLRYRCHEGSLSGDALNRLEREQRVFQQVTDTYDLTADERAEVARMMERQQAAIDVESGKILLRERKFGDARAAFERAAGVLGTPRMRFVAALSRIAPRLLLKVAQRRLHTRP